MSKQLEQNLIKCGLGALLAVTIAGAGYFQLSAPARATDFLGDRGFTNVEVNRVLFGSCGKAIPTIKYTALDQDRYFRTGRVCASWNVKFDK